MEYNKDTDWRSPQVRIQLLTEIKQVILERGWTRGNNEQRGRVCIFGARNTVLFGNPNESDWVAAGSSAALENAITNYFGSWIGITAWNDEVAKSKRDVIKMLDTEIKRLEQYV